MLLGNESNPVNIVVPAVVKPLTLSKRALMTGASSTMIKGIAPSTLVVNHTAVVTSKASLCRNVTGEDLVIRIACPDSKAINAGIRNPLNSLGGGRPPLSKNANSRGSSIAIPMAVRTGDW